MNKILICLLLLANLSSGLAMAWSNVPEVVFGQENSMLDTITIEDKNHPHEEFHQGDHLCHGSAHLVGVFTEFPKIQKISTLNDYFSLNFTFQTLYIHPLLRPPIV